MGRTSAEMVEDLRTTIVYYMLYQRGNNDFCLKLG